MRIGIIETHYHSEFLHTIIQIFKKEDIVVYLTRNVYNELPEISKSAGFTFKQTNQSINDFVSTIPTEVFDYMFINTIQPSMADLPHWRHFKPKCKSILTLHNLNAWYNRKFCLRKNILHSLDSFIASNYSRRILKRFDYINVVYSVMTDLAQKYFNNTHKIINIPFAYAHTGIKVDKKQTIDFVVPGIVSNKRRDYQTIINAFNNLSEHYNNIRLILLGKNVENFVFKNPNIVTFDKYISTVEYNEHLRHADFIVVPSVFFTHILNTVDEYYGFNKSPNIHEAIKWRKPLIVPDYLPLDVRLKSSTIKYGTSNHLERQIRILFKHKQIMKDIKKNAVKNSKPFLLKNIRKKVYEELELT